MNTYNKPYQNTLILMMFSLVLAIVTGCSSSSSAPPVTTAAKTCTVNDGDSGNSSVTNNDGTETFSINLDCDFTVPQAGSDATGSGTVTLDPANGALSGSVTMTGLSGAITAAHIHTGLAGTSGGIIVTLEEDSTNANKMNVPTGTTLSATEMTAMLAAQYYINVHTADNPSGEVRGHIVPDSYQVILVKLEGENQTPDPVVSSNSALGFITLNESSGDIRGNIRNTGLDDAAAAHIHTGFAGTDGGVIVTLSQDAGDVSVWNIPDSTTLNASDLADLLAGKTYFNVHTPLQANGEVRGQIEPDDIKVTRDELNGSQEVPAVTTSLTGIGYATVNENTGVINANIRTSDETTATAAHVHRAAAGINGGIALPLVRDAQDDAFWSADGTLNATELDAFKVDGLYFNVHSVVNAGGEIRAQINR